MATPEEDKTQALLRTLAHAMAMRSKRVNMWMKRNETVLIVDATVIDEGYYLLINRE